MERNIIRLTDVDVDGCGTNIDTLLEINTDVTNGMRDAIETAIENCKRDLEEEWTTDDIIDSVIETLETVYELEVKIVNPVAEIEF